LTKSFEDFFFQGLEAKYPSLPVCTQAQVTNYNIFSENGLECRISGKSFADLKTEFISQFQTENSKLNDSFTYSFQPTATSGTALFWAKGGSWYLVFRIVFYSLSFLLILFLFVIGLMARVSWRSFFRWLSIPIMIPSGLLLILSSTANLIYRFIPSLTSVSDTKESKLIAKIIDPLIRNIFNEINNRKIIELAIIFGICVVMIIISFFLKGISPTATPASATPGRRCPGSGRPPRRRRASGARGCGRGRRGCGTAARTRWHRRSPRGPCPPRPHPPLPPARLGSEVPRGLSGHAPGWITRRPKGLCSRILHKE